jgi:hypothetical protein
VRYRLVAVLFVVGCVLTGVPASAADPLVASPSSLNFQAACVGKKAEKSVTLTNNDPNDDITLDRINVGGPQASDFSVVGFSESQPKTIDQNGGAFTFQVAFTPGASGKRNATLTFETTPSSGQPDPVQLEGDGLDRTLVVVPATLAFGEQRTGARSPEKRVTLRNTGKDRLRIQKISLSGGQATDFQLASSVEFIDGETQFDIKLTFQPRIVGKRSTTLSITSDSCTNPTTSVTLSGTGIAPAIRIDPQVLDLGQVPLGTPSERVPLVVSNDGKAPLKVSLIQIVGADAADFAFESLPTMPRTVAAGDSFLLNVIFTPSGDGTRRAGARVTSDDPGRQIFEITLTGVGGTVSVPPTTSPTPTATSAGTGTATAPPRASGGGGGGGGDWIAIAFVVALVGGAFAGLVVLKRIRGEQG